MLHTCTLYKTPGFEMRETIDGRTWTETHTRYYRARRTLELVGRPRFRYKFMGVNKNRRRCSYDRFVEPGGKKRKKEKEREREREKGKKMKK